MTTSLASLGWDADLAHAYARYRSSGNRPGRISRVDRGVCTVLTDRGTIRASLAGRMLGLIAKDRLAMPSVGDWTVVKRWADDRYTIEAVLPRRSAIVRSSSGRAAEGQAIAANAETVAVVESLDPDPDPGRIERLLALAHESGADPILILTKADAVPDPALLAADFAAVAGAIPVHTVSAHTGSGLEELRDYLAVGRTLALIGSSGAGKSSLVNALVGATVMTTRTLRVDGRGRHTTTHRSLVPVPDGGAIIDTPGLRVVGLFERRPGDAATPADGLARAFDDLDEFAANCRYGDCRHETEPDCAVLAAVGDGVIAARRLENWRKLQREQAFEVARLDARRRGQRRVTRARDRDIARRR